MTRESVTLQQQGTWETDTKENHPTAVSPGGWGLRPVSTRVLEVDAQGCPSFYLVSLKMQITYVALSPKRPQRLSTCQSTISNPQEERNWVCAAARGLCRQLQRADSR